MGGAYGAPLGKGGHRRSKKRWGRKRGGLERGKRGKGRTSALIEKGGTKVRGKALHPYFCGGKKICPLAREKPYAEDRGERNVYRCT